MDKYYSVLGVHSSATLEEITKAYKRRLKIVHPDRFDSRTQLEEWGQANKMLQELNEAFDWIKKNHTVGNTGYSEKKTTDQKTETENKYTSEKSSDRKESGGYTREEQYRKGATRTSIHNLTNTHVHFINSLIADSKNIKIRTPNIYIKSCIFAACAGFIVLILSVFLKSTAILKDEFTGYSITILIATIFATKYGLFIHKYLRSKIKPCVLFTPMYFLHIDFNEIVFGYEWEIDSIKFHREQGGLPYINLRLGDYFGTFSAPLLGLRFFKKKFDKIDNVRMNVTDRAGWFTQNDILRDLKSSPKTETKKGIKALYPYAASITVAIVVCIISSASITLTKYSEPAKARIDNYASREAQHIGNQNNSPVTLIPVTPEFNHEPQPLPPTGHEYHYSGKKGVAPLQIVVPNAGDNYYVKVVTLENKPVKAVFIRSGETVKIRVPLGTYKVKYATGETWYGQKYLFGPSTSATVAESDFDFRVEDDRYTGYTIELIKQVSGNLHSRNISIDEF